MCKFLDKVRKVDSSEKGGRNFKNILKQMINGFTSKDIPVTGIPQVREDFYMNINTDQKTIRFDEGVATMTSHPRS